MLVHHIFRRPGRGSRRGGNRKGVTLVELCVVMAMLSIISTMIISFCMLINRHVHTVSGVNAVQEDLDMIGTALNSWVSSNDRVDLQFSVSPAGELTVSAAPPPDPGTTGGDPDLNLGPVRPSETALPDTPAGTARRFYERDGHLILEHENGSTSDFPLETVTALDFDLREHPTTGQVLLTCTVTYQTTARGSGEKIPHTTAILRTLRAADRG